MFFEKKLSLLYISFLTLVFACSQKQSSSELTPAHQYSLFIMDKAGLEYMLEISDLNNGSLDPASHDIKSEIKGMGREMIIKGGFYYRLNSRTKKFTKYTNDNGRLKEEGGIALEYSFVENYCWISEDSLLIFGKNTDLERLSMRYAIINVSDMTVKKGDLILPLPDKTNRSLAVGFSDVRGKDLILGYTYYIKDREVYRAVDTSYIAVLDYPTMKCRQVYKDTRVASPGTENTVEPGTFKDENGDFYYLSCPGIALGNQPSKPTALCRIKAGKQQPDTSYFFNISALLKNHAYSIYYIGEGKAIVRSERSDLYKKWDEHWKKAHFEFYVLDLATQKSEKLALPLDKGTRRQCIVNEDNVVYISVNSKTEGNYIWIYNKKTGSLKKGLQLTGETDYILRLDKLL